jgi:hypothetical protein
VTLSPAVTERGLTCIELCASWTTSVPPPTVEPPQRRWIGKVPAALALGILAVTVKAPDGLAVV